jgi:hypothetical protein
LVEVPHENTKEACDRAIRIFLETGSHWLTHADWGCHDGVHKAWFVVETDSRDEARLILPAIFRSSAAIISVERFGPEDLEGARQEHPG